MRHLIKPVILFISLQCYISCAYALNINSSTDTNNHFYSLVDKAQFDTLHGAVFTWTVFKPINDTISFIRFHNRASFIKKLFCGQKVLFYLQELDGAVMQDFSGFANLYYNYKSDISEIKKSLRFVNDQMMLEIMKGASKIYLLHYKKINAEYQRGNWEFVQKQFAVFDNAYFDKREHTMRLLERYIRQHKEEFLKFK